MKIAIYHNLPSGGGKRALYEMARRLAQRHTLDVYTLSSADHAYCDLRPLARQHVVYPFAPLPLARPPFGRLNQGIRAVDLWRLRRLQRRIASDIDAAGYDLVFVHPCRFGTSPSLLRYLTTPSVYYLQEPPRRFCEPAIVRPYNAVTPLDRAVNRIDPLPGLYRRVLLREDRVSARRATRLLVNSCYSRESVYRTYGADATVCYLGVDTDQFRPLPVGKGDYVLSVGMVNPVKGFDFLLRSLALIPPVERPPLVICGNAADPRERDYTERLAAELGVLLEVRTMVSDDELV
ncbi:MAG: glycosyltransferase family 4 protein, partial [Chloroflexi bacterium]|nr:glycosyltransferase family 4 protein [Chloroflexota bacterium]